MKRLLSYGSKAVLVMMVGVATLTTGCRLSDGEVAPVPQSAENPLDASVYYVSGTLTDQSGSGVSGVAVMGGTVSATTNSSGYYELTIEATSATAANTELVNGVEFSIPSGYVGETTVPAIFPTGTEKGATLTVNHSISVANEPVTVDTTTATTLVVTSGGVEEGDASTAGSEDVVIEFEQAALSTEAEVTITPIVPASTAEVLELAVTETEETLPEEYYTPAAALAIDLGEATLEAAITVSIPESSSSIVSKADSGSSYYFKDVKGKIYESGVWSNSDATVGYNNNYYSFSVNPSDVNTSSFSVGVTPSLAVAISATQTADLSTKVINNFNYTDVVTETYTYSKYVGLVESSFQVGDVDSTESVIKSEMKAYLETLLGSIVNTTATKESVSDTAVVSGDTKVTVTYTQNYATYTITAKVTTDGSDEVTATYKARYYGVVNRAVVTEEGNMSYIHNF